MSFNSSPTEADQAQEGHKGERRQVSPWSSRNAVTKGAWLRRHSTEPGCEGDSGKGSPRKGRGVKQREWVMWKTRAQLLGTLQRDKTEGLGQMAKSKCHLFFFTWQESTTQVKGYIITNIFYLVSCFFSNERGKTTLHQGVANMTLFYRTAL